MSYAVTTPWLLLLLPLALLPLLYGAQTDRPYPSLAAAETDSLSFATEWGLRFLGSIAIVALVLGVAGLHGLGLSIKHVGEGADIVLLFDRSSSMDNTFAGETPTEQEKSKSAAAVAFLTSFVSKRPHDRFGVAAFSTSPMFVLPLSDHKDATLAAVKAIDFPGLDYTNVAKGLAMALSMHEEDASSSNDADLGARAIVLVSDGAAVIDRKVQEQLRAAFTKRPLHLYWIFLRTAGSNSIFAPPAKGEEDTPQVYPERHLHLFFQSLNIPYQAFEAENPAAIQEAVAAIDKLERKPVIYREPIPQRDLSGAAYGIAAIALMLIVAAKLAETELGGERARAAGRSSILESTERRAA